MGQGVRALNSSCFIFSSFCQSFQKTSYLSGNTLSTICMLFVHKAQNCHFSSQCTDFHTCLIWAKDAELLALLGCMLTCVWTSSCLLPGLYSHCFVIPFRQCKFKFKKERKIYDFEETTMGESIIIHSWTTTTMLPGLSRNICTLLHYCSF